LVNHKKKPDKKASLLSGTYIFGSFFGAFMVASAYAYFNFKFSEYRFIDFNNYTFYTKKDIFIPKENIYVLLMYSSHSSGQIDKIKDLKVKYPIIALDIHQKRFESNDRVIYVTTGINSIINIIQKFNFYNTPTLLFIERQKGLVYKQSSQLSPL
jgi:hypothetical protein